jgi:putative ABC transport system permease protein
VSPRWEVFISSEAAATLRDVSRSASAVIAQRLDDLARHGVAGIAREPHENEWVGTIQAGDHEITVAGRDGDARIVVVQIQLTERHRAHQAVDVLPLKVSTRRRLGWGLEGLDLDFRYTLRVLRRSPVFTAVVMTTLAIGFGGTAALLDIVNTVYNHALPFGDGERLVRLRNVNQSPDGDLRRYNLTPNDTELLRRHGRSFSGVVAMAGRSLSLTGDGPAERVSAIGVSPDWTGTLRIRPLLGRTFTAEEERAGADAGVAMISYALWQGRFGLDSTILGRRITYDGGSLVVVGVMPRQLNYPYDAAIWTPWTFPLESRSSSLNVVARLSDGVTLAMAQADADRVHAERFASNLQGSATGYNVATVRSDFIREEARTIQALSTAVLFLLVLAFVNVANLLVARFSTRRGELGVRAALGGRRDQQLRQLLLETVVLFTGGAAGGMALGYWLRRLMSVTMPEALRTELGFPESGVGGIVALATLAIGLAGGLVVGLIAARRAIRLDPIALVRQGGRGSIGTGDRRVFNVLVAAQLSLSLGLLVGASLLIGRFQDLSNTHPGYELAGVSTMRITIEQERYRTAEARSALVRTLEKRLAVVPGVESVGITTVNPLCCGDWGAPIEIEGRPVAPGQPATLVAHSYVTPGYFGTMSIPLRRGKGYDDGERPNGPLTVVIDEPFAAMAWPNEDPIGKRVRMARDGQPWRTVIGVVPVTEHEAEMRANWFLPYYQDPTGPSTEQLHLMVRRSAAVSTASLREIVRAIDPGLGVYGVTMMESLQRDRTAQDRLGAIVSGVFALFGLVLAGFSLYGLLSYSVELRSHEMGLRLALGASRGTIVGLVLRQAGARLLVGSVIGIAMALVVNQALRAAIEGLSWVPWQTLLSLTLIMAGVTAIAAAAPALRATRVDPIRSLRG